jgi:hypothetical protein
MAADALSRLVRENKEETEMNDDDEYVKFIAYSATPIALKTKDIERESNCDESMMAVRHCIETRNWDECPNGYKPIRNELCVVGKLVLRGCRIVIPDSLRDQVVRLGHEGHQGIVKTKQRLRTNVWWPKMDNDVDKVCKSCYGCQLVAQPSPPEPMKRSELPSLPWQHTAGDLFTSSL